MKSASAETDESAREDVSLRRRRALYRATHRGTQEMDYLLGRYAVAAVAGMDAREIAVLERLVERPDPEIEFGVKQGVSLGEPALDELIAKLRRFHGLTGTE